MYIPLKEFVKLVDDLEQIRIFDDSVENTDDDPLITMRDHFKKDISGILNQDIADANVKSVTSGYEDNEMCIFIERKKSEEQAHE